MLVSIIVRTFNEEQHLGRLLHDIFNQTVEFDYEVVIVDSGSTDSTLDIAQRYNVKIVQILPEEFTFGYSLNKGIDNADGDYCVMVSAHCYPENEFWLKNIILPFENQMVAYVFGRQKGIESTRYYEHQIFAKWFPEISDDDFPLAFGNNANSAIRKSVWKKYEFNQQLTGLEDMDWAKHIKENGFKIAYRADAIVYHIHNETLKQVYNRYYREAWAYKSIYPAESFSSIDFVKCLSMNVIGDYLHSIKDKMFFSYFFEIPIFRFAQFWGTYKAHLYKKPISKIMQRKLYYPRHPRTFFSSERVLENVPSSSAVRSDLTPVTSNKISENEIFDITKPLTPEIPVWPGSKNFILTTVKTFENDKINENEMSLNLHTGTHMDAPLHFINNGKTIDQVSIEKMQGEVQVLEFKEEDNISREFFEKAIISKSCKKILVKSRNSGNQSNFDKDFVALTKDAAQWLADGKYDLIGVDGPSVQLFHDSDNSTHEILLGAEIVILEGLDLFQVPPGIYNLNALPMNISNVEASPVRAILTKGIIK